MFLDLVFNFCCSKRQRDEKDTKSQNSNKSQEEQFLEQRRIELDIGKTAMNELIKSKPASSIGSPTDNYLQLNDEKQQQKKSSFEEDNVQENQFDIEDGNKGNHYQMKDHSGMRSKSQEKVEKGLKKKISKAKEKQDGDKRVVKIWQPEEDQRLRKLYQEYQGNWSKIIQFMPERNISQCSQRWRRINPIQNKQKWNQEEDAKLVQLVAQEGKNWTKLARHFQGRSGKQIRERYLNKLDPALNFVPWTEQEDQEIVKYYNQYGAKWSVVASHLKGRSENMVKNRFYSHIQKHLLGRQNKYQIIFNSGHNQQNGNQQQQEGNQNMDVEYSDTSNSEQKLVHSENYSSSIGSSTFTFSYYEDEDFSGNGQDLLYDNQFEQDFDEKARVY